MPEESNTLSELAASPIMPVYLDYNVIASSVGIPEQPDGMAEVAAMLGLQQLGMRFALSAWTAYELAKSQDEQHVRQCCTFIEGLKPVWISDWRYLADRELAAFVARHGSRGADGRALTIHALNETIGQMWSTFGVHIALREGFTDCVMELRAQPRNLNMLANAAAFTPPAITASRAQRTEGKADDLRDDRQHFAQRLGCRERDERVEFLMANRAKLYQECPTLAIEDALRRVRANDSFRPNASHAADLQHAMAALGYCDHFVTRDGQLRGHARIVVRDLGLPCAVYARVGELPMAGAGGRREKASPSQASC
jgi:hypothetical protein